MPRYLVCTPRGMPPSCAEVLREAKGRSVRTPASPRDCCTIPQQGREKTSMNWGFTNQNPQLCVLQPCHCLSNTQKRAE